MKKTTKRILAITSVVIVICISSVMVYSENQTDEAENYFYTAELYARGLGVEQNNEKASYWYHKAADEGNIKAISQLGAYYLLGDVVEPDAQKGIYYLEKAASMKDEKSMFMLATAYLSGSVYGIDKDMTKCIYWFKKTAENGSKEPSGMLEQFMTDLKEAANRGNKDAIQIWKEIEPYYQ